MTATDLRHEPRELLLAAVTSIAAIAAITVMTVIAVTSGLAA